MRVAALLLGVSILAACEEPEAGTHSIAQVLEATNAAKDRAMVAGDRPALENFYTADYQIVDANGDMHDRRNRVEYMTGEVDLLSAASSDVEVRMLSKNAALVTGRLRGAYRRDGKESPFHERFTSIWVSEDSQWRFRHEHSSDIGSSR